MKNINLDKKIVFIDKKAEYKRKNKIPILDLNKLRGKNKIIKYQEHKKSKVHKARKQKLLNSKLYKFRKTIIATLTLILSLLVILFLWNKFFKPSYTESSESNFRVERHISNSDKSTYSSIIKESVKKTLGIKYNVTVEQLHRNGNLIFSKGYFTIPNKGDINFDMILQNYSPCSLKVNGDEYIKK